MKSRDHSTGRSWVVADNIHDGGNGTTDGERVFGESVLFTSGAGNGGGSHRILPVGGVDDGVTSSGFGLTDTSNTLPTSGPFTSMAALRIDDTVDHVINASESGAVKFEVSGLTSGATGTVTFT